MMNRSSKLAAPNDESISNASENSSDSEHTCLLFSPNLRRRASQRTIVYLTALPWIGMTVCIFLITFYLAMSANDDIIYGTGVNDVSQWDDINNINYTSNITARDIYCHGPILQAIQLIHATRDGGVVDSKDFVDRPMKSTPAVIWNDFQKIASRHPEHRNIPRKELQLFLDTHFDEPASDLKPASPADFNPTPTTLMNIRNDTMRQWALELNDLWKDFGRTIELSAGHIHSSLLPTSNMIIVPGGRFREAYYWDSYWIVKGLLACEMYDTARGIVDNLLAYVQTYGFVPNGGRIYYTDRSQPPFLSEMVAAIYDYRKEDSLEWLQHAVSTLDIEYSYWMNNQTSFDTNTKLNRYISSESSPRPESYWEDYTKVPTSKKNSTDAENWYRDIRAAAASGWDFSSRWFHNGSNLSYIHTSDVIPVDLNCVLHRMEQNMARFYSILHNDIGRNLYETRASERRSAINNVLWDESSSMWRDYWLDTKQLSKIESASNFLPLWSESYDTSNSSRTANILDAFENSRLLKSGGVVTTMTLNSTEQWDAPNAWAPIQDLLIEGFSRTQTRRGSALAHTLRESWLNTCLTGWLDTQPNGIMYEKYVVMENSHSSKSVSGGVGGEYKLQLGFGWTNGVVLKLLTNT